jgi:hypothetical protein
MKKINVFPPSSEGEALRDEGFWYNSILKNNPTIQNMYSRKDAKAQSTDNQ